MHILFSFFLLLSFLHIGVVGAEENEQPPTPAASEEVPAGTMENGEAFQVTEPDEEELSAAAVKEEEGTSVDTAVDTSNAVQTDGSNEAEEEENLDDLLKGLGEEPEDQKRREAHTTNTVVLQGLNKITARISSLKATVGQRMRFGTLEIIVRRCVKSAADETPDSKALLEIWEQKPGEAKTRKFYGWMFASSPALSALEHPVYDVVLLQCE